MNGSCKGCGSPNTYDNGKYTIRSYKNSNSNSHGCASMHIHSAPHLGAEFHTYTHPNNVAHLPGSHCPSHGHTMLNCLHSVRLETPMSTNKLEFSALNLGIIAECVAVNLGIAQNKRQCIFSGLRSSRET